MNETFYDLGLITDLDADQDYLEGIHGLDHVISGYAVVPVVGGGTNNSEYELLSSNSLYLMPGVTPFNVIDMQDAYTVVSHLKKLGYVTIAAHPGVSYSYQRSRVYPQMGFDEIYFLDDYIELTYFGNRIHATDESVYQNLIRWYEERKTQSPILLYCLTIQNHGGWESLSRAEDIIVHARTDYGVYDGQVDEFLSCIALSDESFVSLTEYFAKLDREVILCMVGDHAPYIASEIMDNKYTEWERELYLRSVPFVIWANYDIEDKAEEILSMNYVVPLVLDVAGITKSPYYAYMSDMMEVVPVITSYGVYFDIWGNRYPIGEQTPYAGVVDQYFMMEYNNISTSRRDELFEPYE